MIKDKNKLLAAVGIAVCLIATVAVPVVNKNKDKPEEITYREFMGMVGANQVKEIEWEDDKEDIVVVDFTDQKYSTENPKYEDFKKEMLENGINVKEDTGFFSKNEGFFMFMLNVTVYIVFIFIMMKTTGILGGFKGFKDKEGSTNVKFSDVAGLEEVKEDLMAVVDFLKNPEKYKEAGADTPKGVLLYGPPGTGKTLLAKAVAGEAGVKFKAVTGSDFDEKYVGVGASKMRKLFEDAKENAPCIIFIDEIDCMGGKRSSRQSNYDRQTLNSLLSEMDGFDGSSGVVVIAATNRIEDLDSALTRPGRFDNHFAVSLPETSKERRLIIDLYSENKKFAEDVDLDVFAKETVGSSPAAIKTVLNEAAIIATRKNDGIINRAILDEAWLKQLMEGHLKKNSEKNNVEIVAWHEAGHALAGLLLNQDLTKVSVIPSTSGAGGATFITPKKTGLFTKAELEEQVIMLYSGRNAERILTSGNEFITTGASNDIEKATAIIKEMITDYGMDDKFGMINMDVMGVDNDVILNEAVEIANALNEKSVELLWNNKDVLKRIAERLIEKETLTGEEVRAIAEYEVCG